jgi:drug/metabolite transporter (DMT)-like permease
MEEAHPRQPNMAGELALLLVLATLWGASYTFIRVAVATIPPITLIAGRTAIAGLLLIIMRWRGARMPRDALTWRRFLFQACLNSVIPWTMIAWGERTLDAGLATILNSTSPIFTFFLTLVVSRHEALTSRKLFGVVAGMAGICLIVGVQALAGFGEQFWQIVTVLAAIYAARRSSAGDRGPTRWLSGAGAPVAGRQV